MSQQAHKANILYVDDERDNLMVFRVAFRRYFNIFTAESATEGLELLKQEHIQVVVTDQRMPEMTGVEFLSRIPEEPYMARIILTAFTEADALIEAVNTGRIFRYITKPWKLEDLRQTLENAFQHQQLYVANQQLLLDLQDSNQKLATANNSLKELNRQLLALDAAKSEFLNIISHEIKTPLNGIMGLTRLLSNQIDDQQYRKYFDALLISIDRLDEFSQNAIFLTELETQRYKLSRQHYNLNDLLQAALSQLRHKLADKPVKIEASASFKAMSANVDGNLLRRSLIVLLDNALRYSPEENGTIWIDATRNHNTVTVSVTDEGPGFSEQAMERLFKYFGIGESHYDQRVGLGLSLVKLIMHQLNGTVEVKHPEGKGAGIELRFEA